VVENGRDVPPHRGCPSRKKFSILCLKSVDFGAK